jgi:lipid-binding SYLF domain-containing protein
MSSRPFPSAIATSLLMLAVGGPVHAQAVDVAPGAQAGKASASDTATRRQQAAAKRLSDAAAVASTMGAAPGMHDLLAKARGVYIVPTYGRAALGVGAAGGAGVLMVKQSSGSWGNPVFFNLGGLSLGLQAGAEGGAIALVLMNQKAVDSFRNRNNFSLSADAGITVINYARMAQGTTTGDVVAWSGGKGLFGNAATVALNDIRYNQRLTEAYYGKPVTALQAIDSIEPNAQADPLRRALEKPGTAPAATGR